jgi:hypothetical protein
MTACPMDYVVALRMENRSNHNLYMCPLRTDTLFYNEYFDYEVIQRKDTVYVDVSHLSGGFEAIYREWKADTLSFMFLDNDTLVKYGWDYMRRNYRVLVRYDLSLDDINFLRETLTYPPTPAMQDMKMYPPYSTHFFE